MGMGTRIRRHRDRAALAFGARWSAHCAVGLCRGPDVGNTARGVGCRPVGGRQSPSRLVLAGGALLCVARAVAGLSFWLFARARAHPTRRGLAGWALASALAI